MNFIIRNKLAQVASEYTKEYKNISVENNK